MNDHRYREIAAEREDRIEFLAAGIEHTVNWMQFECDGPEVELTVQLVEQWEVQMRVDIGDQAEPVGVEPGNRYDVLDCLDPRGARAVFAEQQRVIDAFVSQESVQRRRVGCVAVIRIPPWVVA